MSKWVAGVLASLAAGFTLAGCGAEDALSKQELIAKGDVLCAKADREAEALGEPRTVAEVRRLVGVFDAMVSDFSALEPPNEDRAKVDAMLRDLDRGFSRLGVAFARATAAGRAPGTVRADEAWRLLERAGAAARAYGFGVCGNEA